MLADECANIALPLPQIHDWITDDLARPMVRDIAAAIRRVVLDTSPAQRFFGREHMFLMPVTANRHNMRVLDKKQVVDTQTLFAFRSDLVLVIERAVVTHASEYRALRTHALIASP